MGVEEQQRSMRRNYIVISRAIGAIFGVFIVLTLLLNIVTPTRQFSEAENRSLSTRPALSLASVKSGSWFSDFNEYFSDQFLGRDLCMSINAWRNILTLKPESSGVYFGSDGQLFSEDIPLSKKAQDHTVTAINDYVANHPELNYYMMVLPKASTIQKDRLPLAAPAQDQNLLIDEFEKGLDDKVVRLDASPALMDAKDDYIYYKTDHHWTSDGAYKVFQQTAPDMGIDLSKTGYTRYLVADGFEGTLGSKSGKHTTKDQICVYQPNDTKVQYFVSYPDTQEKYPSMFMEDKLEGKDKYLLFFGGNHPVVDIKTTADTDDVLLVFKDSYANCYMQFLYPYYRRIIMVDPRYYYDNVNTILRTANVTDVLFLYSADTLLADTNLADTLIAAEAKPENSMVDEKTPAAQ